MKFLFDLFPVILFFIAYKFADIYVATGVVIVATMVQIAWVHFRHGKVDKMLWVSLVLVTVFGGMTLIFQDETFIKWKPTILYWAFAGSMAFAALVLRKNPIKAMLGEQMTLPEPVWGKVNLSWIAFFLFMGVLNLIVAFNFSTDVWVNFKLFGGMGLLLLFVLGQGLMLSKYVEDKQ